MARNKFVSIFLIIGVLFLSACSQNQLGSTNEDPNQPAPPSADVIDTSEEKGIGGSLLKDADWTMQKVGLNDQSVEQLASTEQGILFALSEGTLYEMTDIHEATNISGDMKLSTFHIVETENASIIVAGGSQGEIYLYSTLDAQWEVAEADTYKAPISIISSNHAGEIYVGQSSRLGGGLWKSQHLGKTWSKINDLTVRGIAIHPQQSNVVYVVDKLAYISMDGGHNFIRINTKANYGVLIHPLQSDAIYHAFSIGVEATDVQGNISSYMKFYLEGSMTKLELNPLYVNEWLMGFWDYPAGKGGLYFSENHGSLWTQVEGELKDKLVLDITFSHDGTLAYIATRGHGIWAIHLPSLRNTNPS